MNPEQWDALRVFLIANPEANPGEALRNLLIFGRPEGCPSCEHDDCPYHIPGAKNWGRES